MDNYDTRIPVVPLYQDVNAHHTQRDSSGVGGAPSHESRSGVDQFFTGGGHCDPARRDGGADDGGIASTLYAHWHIIAAVVVLVICLGCAAYYFFSTKDEDAPGGAGVTRRESTQTITTQHPPPRDGGSQSNKMSKEELMALAVRAKTNNNVRGSHSVTSGDAPPAKTSAIPTTPISAEEAKIEKEVMDLLDDDASESDSLSGSEGSSSSQD